MDLAVCDDFWAGVGLTVDKFLPPRLRMRPSKIGRWTSWKGSKTPIAA